MSSDRQQDDLMMMLGRVLATQDALMRNQDALLEVVQKHIERDERNFEQVREAIKEVEDGLDTRVTEVEGRMKMGAGMLMVFAPLGAILTQFIFDRVMGK